MNPEYVKRIEQIGIKISDVSLKAGDHQELECLLCANKFIATPKSKLCNYKQHNMKGCPKCTTIERYNTVNDKNEQKLLDMGYILLEPYKGLHKSIVLSNPKCKCGGTPWKTQPDRIFTGRSFCAPCNIEKKRNRFIEFNEDRSKNALTNKDGFSLYQYKVRKLTRENYKQYKNIINPNNLTRVRAENNNGYQLDHAVSIKYCFSYNIPPEICANPSNLRIIPRMDNAIKHCKPLTNFPDIFIPYISMLSNVNTFIEVLTNINKNFIINEDTLLTPFLFTAVDYDKNLVIYFIGLNEHVEQIIKNKNYFIDLKNTLNEKGFKGIFIFEDEWVKNANLITYKLMHICGNNNATKIYARNCVIKEITNTAKNDFVKINHIQGADKSKINLGAFYKDTLIAVMTFCDPRISQNRKKLFDGEYELSRFCTDNSFRVIGIASKLLSYFKKTFNWKELYTFADLRWSDGNLYKQLGFIHDYNSDPNYFYIIENTRKHRFGFRKSVLLKQFPESFDPNLTEYQNMLKMGFDRVWDCGNMKFTMKKESIQQL